MGRAGRKKTCRRAGRKKMWDVQAGKTSGKDREKESGKTGRQEDRDSTDKQGRYRLDRQAGRNSLIMTAGRIRRDG